MADEVRGSLVVEDLGSLGHLQGQLAGQARADQTGGVDRHERGRGELVDRGGGGEGRQLGDDGAVPGALEVQDRLGAGVERDGHRRAVGGGDGRHGGGDGRGRGRGRWGERRRRLRGEGGGRGVGGGSEGGGDGEDHGHPELLGGGRCLGEHEMGGELRDGLTVGRVHQLDPHRVDARGIPRALAAAGRQVDGEPPRRNGPSVAHVDRHGQVDGSAGGRREPGDGQGDAGRVDGRTRGARRRVHRLVEGRDTGQAGVHAHRQTQRPGGRGTRSDLEVDVEGAAGPHPGGLGHQDQRRTRRRGGGRRPDHPARRGGQADGHRQPEGPARDGPSGAGPPPRAPGGRHAVPPR